MKNLQQLREERTAKIDAATALFDKAKAENRSLSDEEKTEVRNLQNAAESLKSDIDIAEVQERNAASLAGQQKPVNNHSTTEKRSLASYSLLKAVRSTLPPSHDSYRALDGVEAEMHQEAVRENRSLGGEGIKGLGIPQMLIATRDNSVTMPTQPEDGSAVVEREVRPVLDFLRPKSVIRDLGAQFLTGLVGNIGMGELATGAVSTWKGEIETLDKSNQKFVDREFSPNRLGTFAIRSKQFLAQTAPSIERMLRADLENSVVQKLDRTAIDGIGTGNIPQGIINNPDVNQVALGANGGAFTRGTAIALLAAVMNSNIPLTNPGYLMNVNTMAALMNTKVDAGSGQFLMDEANKLFGYDAAVTTNVPGDITKGSGTGLSALIFGNWSDLLIGQWGGLDITTDPYTLATEGQVRIIIQGFYDIMVQRAKAFAVVKDVNTTLV
ncbi:phage major capsid protein [Hymenobacter sp. BT175]|uniref:phage major capsid protein n=1 Tax=Hymenobacter translucens TaxID=2886507 RepID=UPI001D0EBDA5|nr:phage major capsid protein [Hymenobacter translucens]MCC2547710.1 phage major capsid protein [Hymenobacter translucens]